jgi:signal transduction histidine kinase
MAAPASSTSRPTPLTVLHPDVAAMRPMSTSIRPKPASATLVKALRRQLQVERAKREICDRTARASAQTHKRMLKEAVVQRESLRLLSRRTLAIQEEERKRISRELHDIIAQMLTGIHFRLSHLKLSSTVDARSLAGNITRTLQLVDKSAQIVHRFARELRPAILDDLGLIPAMHAKLVAFTASTGIRATLTAFPALEKLEIRRRTVLYRVLQECLANIGQHSGAAHCQVVLTKDGERVRMTVQDDGRGFVFDSPTRVLKAKRLGLLGMQERLEMVGGKFAIASALGEGTTVTAHVPFRKTRAPRGKA